MAFTYFFRDQQTLDLIAQYVIPTLKQHTYIHVWDAGCAMGPEPYSLAMILRENMGPFMFRNVRIEATDIDESGEFGEVIARGIYAVREVERIPPELLAKYFAPVPNNGGAAAYQISAEMRQAVRFQRHDLLSLQPIREGVGLIVCKNVLLHLTPEQRVAVIKMFHAALAPDGYFVTEQTQKLPDETLPLFQQVSGAGQIFQKVDVPTTRGVPPRDLPAPATCIEGCAAAISIQIDPAFTRVSQYTWLNLDKADQRIGKARVSVSGKTLTIYTLSIFPEFEHNGYAQQVIGSFKETYAVIVADSVRPTARGFWEKVGFTAARDGNYIWENGMGGL